MERIIEAYGLGKASLTKGAPPILDNCSISIGPGMTAVVGPSGAGKTSLLYALSGLDVPNTGQVLAFGQDVYALPDGQRTRFLRERVGFVFQDYNLVPYLTVKENALLPLSLAGHRGDPAQLGSTSPGFRSCPSPSTPRSHSSPCLHSRRSGRPL